jgi:SAM-dependent methyltransferase
MLISPIEAYTRWSATYDATPNPITALETRLLAARLCLLPDQRLFDAGCGTGRWMAWAAARGIRVFGADLCMDMIAHAVGKVHHRCALADLVRLPFADNSFDTALCSFTLGYVPCIERALAELSRVARDVIVSDLHPEAIRQGWTRSFRAGVDSWEIEHHRYSLHDLDEAASHAGLIRRWRIEAPLGHPERRIFQQAGKEAAFAASIRFPAVAITAWRNRSA